MIFYRRNTFSDKVVSFIGVMLAVIMMYHNVQAFQVLGTFNIPDFIVAVIGLAVGIIFLYTSRFKYLEISESQLTWYTWFFVKHTLTKDHIKDITMKKRYFIISKEKGSDIWISKLYIRNADDEKVNDALKRLIEGR